MLRTILFSALCTVLCATLLCGCKEKKKAAVVETEPKTQYGKAINAAQSLKDELDRQSEEKSDAMNEASADE